MTKNSNQSKKIVLLDGNAIIHRAFHALPPLTTKSGELVNAVYGFSSTLLSVIEKFQPDYIAAAFDLAAPTFRHEKFEAYKATRTKAPDELYTQIPRVKHVVETFNIPIYELAGFEADDVIGTLAQQAAAQDIEVLIVTGDMDALQLVTDKIKVYAMRRGISDAVLFDRQAVQEKYGFPVEHLIDYKGLRGDPSDNIPGVKGVGEKTATELIKKYQSIAGVYEHLGEIKGATKDKLERDRANAFLSRELSEIKLDVPVTLDLRQAQTHEFERDKLAHLFGELNFFSLVKRIPIDTNQANRSETTNENESTKKNLGIKDFKYFTTPSVAELEELKNEIIKQQELAISLEKTGAQIAGYGLSAKTGRAYFVSREQISQFKEILANPQIKKVGFDLKQIYKALHQQDLLLAGCDFDVLLALYVLDPGRPIAFGQAILEHLGEEVNLQPEKKGQLSFLETLDNSVQVADFACKKADYALKLQSVLQTKMAALAATQTGNTVQTLFETIEMPLLSVLADMELTGIKLNPTLLAGIAKKLEKKIAALEKNIHGLAGKEFNVNSPSQLAKVLFEDLQIPTFGIKKIKTGFSTASAELEKIKETYPIAAKVEEYRELFKLKTTYLDPLPTYLAADGRIHSSFNQAITATGRLSSADPNLQNIPVKTELSQLIRTAFIAETDCVLISGDYSQIDLRVVAHVSGDKKMIAALSSGEDIHRLTAAEINGVTPSKVTDQMRRSAKELNFGVIYGMGAHGFARSSGVGYQQAQQFINTYFEKFSGVAEYMKQTREFVKAHGFVETELGRRRNIPEINSPNFQIANSAERMAINLPIQGLAADIMKLAMLKVHAHFQANPAVKMVLQVHDEIILEAPRAQANQIAQELKVVMEKTYRLQVPLLADVHVGESWGEI